MKGRSRKGCVMGTSIHKKASSSPVKFLGDLGDSIRQGFDDIMYGHIPPPPEHVNPNMADVRIGDTWGAPGTQQPGGVPFMNPQQQQVLQELQERNDPRNDPANSWGNQLKRAWGENRLFDPL